MNTKFDVAEELELRIKAKICSIRINEEGKDEIFGPLDDYVIMSKEW